MSRYEFEDKNCVVYADERFGEIRTVRDENGERRYVGCLLYTSTTFFEEV